jgi:hypothetical protein
MTTILKYQRMHTLLNEKQWRQYLATEAEERGNAAAVAREAGVSIDTIARGRRDIEAGDHTGREIASGQKAPVQNVSALSTRHSLTTSKAS